MAALVQSLPSPSSSTLTMLQARPSSSEAFQNSSSGQQHQRNHQMPINIYNTSVGGMAAGSYRGNTGAAPGAGFSFQGSSIIQNGSNPLRQHPTAPHHPRYESRAASTPNLPTMQSINANNAGRRPSASGTFAPLQLSSSNDGSTLSRPLATLDPNMPTTQPTTYANAAARSAPDRYKRNHRRADTAGALTSNPPTSGQVAVPSGSGMASVGHLYNHPTQSSSSPALSSYPNYRGVSSSNTTNHTPNTIGHRRLSSQDDMAVQQRQPSSDLAKRYRRRSISSLDAKEFDLSNSEPSSQAQKPKTYAAMLASPAPSPQKEARASNRDRPALDSRRDSSESGSVTSSAKSFSARKGPDTSVTAAQLATSVAKHEPQIVQVPARKSSEPIKRFNNPSPLSKPMSMGSDRAANSPSNLNESPKLITPLPSVNPSTSANGGISESPAAQQLAALSRKDVKKEGKSSRLRRAFSFGSAAELRKASAENNANAARERNKLQKPQFGDEEDAQQAAIAQQQEASGLGESIYSGQGHFFTGSTDNLSISSTASSASVMIRKMGKGVKRGSRSLVGLFRPKSVVGVPAADGPLPEASLAQVSMVTVEAEREKVNVNANPHDHAGGGTGFPKLERNSIDASGLTETQRGHSDSLTRRSIVGGERDRAEVLAAVKKGILKRTGTDSGNSSPLPRNVDPKNSNYNLPQIPRVNDSPNSSAPSTPADEHTPRAQGNRDSVHLEGEEYFLNIQKYANGSATSLPGTQRGNISRNISFSPRINFHDTWTSGEYDRRGEIATCNRLTPMLAQQIKEELNSFKMEMEVHVESKVYTHFF